MRIVEIDPLDPDAITLLHAAAKEIRPLYDSDFDPGGKMPTNLPPVPGSVYLVALLEGRPIGSIGLRPYEGTTGEIIRMYVLPDYRRRHVARKLLEQVEAAAVELGYQLLRLETGKRQPAAMALYESRGYRRIPAFGKYSGDPTSVCYEKEMDAASPGW